MDGRAGNARNETQATKKRKGERGRRRRKLGEAIEEAAGHPSPPRCGLASFGKRVRRLNYALPLTNTKMFTPRGGRAWVIRNRPIWLLPRSSDARKRNSGGRNVLLFNETFCSPNRIEGRRWTRKEEGGQKKKRTSCELRVACSSLTNRSRRKREGGGKR